MARKSVWPVVVEPLHARKVRGPCKRDPRPYVRVVEYRDGGEVIHWTGRATPTEVRDVMLGLVRRGLRAPEPRKTTDRAVTTVSHLLRAWIKHVEASNAVQPLTLAGYKTCARRVIATIGDLRIAHLTTVCVSTHVTTRRDAGDKDSTLRQDLMVLGVAWRFGVDVGVCPNRELAMPRMPAKPTEVAYTPPMADVMAVLDLLDAKYPAWRADLLRLQLFTGCRVSEIAALHVDDVDLAGGTIRVGTRESARKTGERTVVVMDPAALRILERLVAGRTRGRLLPVGFATAAHPTKWLRAACAEAKVRPWTSHALRRMYVDFYRRRGVSVEVLAAQAGHSPAVMLRHYRTAHLEDVRAEMARARGISAAQGAVVPFPSARATGGDDDR